MKTTFKDYILQDHRLRFPKLDFKHILGHYLLTPSFRIVLYYRMAQYYQGKKGIMHSFANFMHIRTCNKFLVTIDPETEIGPGLKLPHGGPLVLNPATKIGKFCTIHPNVLVGGNRLKSAPVIGDNCYLGNGAKIIGPVHIGDWAYIAPGAIITKDVPTGALMGSGLNLLLNMDGKKHVKLYMQDLYL